MEPTYDLVPAEENDDSGMSTGAAMLVGSGLTLLGLAAVRAGRKVYAKIKAKKEASDPDDEIVEAEVVEDTNLEEDDDEPKK